MTSPRIFRMSLVAFIAGIGTASFFESYNNLVFFIVFTLGFSVFILAVFGRTVLASPQSYKRLLLIGGIFFIFALGVFRFVVFPQALPLQGLDFISPTLAAVKEAFREKIFNILPEPHSLLATSLLFGARENPSKELRLAFQRSGTSHIVAISGWNIAIIAQFLFTLFLWLTLPRGAAFWFTISSIILFAIMVGAEASVVRAAIMGSLLLFARRTGRLPSARNALLFAASLMLIWDPRLLARDIGFELSFLATLGMIYLMPYFEERVFTKLPSALAFRETLAATLSAQIFVLPILLVRFNTFSLVSLPANIAILPFIPITMLAVFLSSLLGFLSWLSSYFVGLIAWVLLSYELFAVRLFASFSWAEAHFNFPWLGLVGYYVLLAIWIWHIRRHKFPANKVVLSKI